MLCYCVPVDGIAARRLIPLSLSLPLFFSLVYIIQYIIIIAYIDARVRRVSIDTVI